MKKSTVIVFAFIVMCFGCSDTIEFNNPAFQANREGVTWKADFFAADIDFGKFLFEGRDGVEVLQLIPSDDRRGTYILGPDSESVAIFRDAIGTVFSTANLPDPSITLFPPDGEIVVQSLDNSDPMRVTGTFRFTAFSEDGLQSVTFIDGVFFRISLSGGLEAIE